jgi:hypothetical protein
MENKNESVEASPSVEAPVEAPVEAAKPTAFDALNYILGLFDVKDTQLSAKEWQSLNLAAKIVAEELKRAQVRE